MTVARDPLRVIAQNPTNVINGALEAFTVTFNVPIDPNSFATTDARVVGPVILNHPVNDLRLAARRRAAGFRRQSRDHQVGQRRQLNAGQENRQITVTLPEGISGTYYLFAVPDAANDVNEGDGESRGVTSTSISVSLFPYADLTSSRV